MDGELARDVVGPEGAARKVQKGQIAISSNRARDSPSPSEVTMKRRCKKQRHDAVQLVMPFSSGRDDQVPMPCPDPEEDTYRFWVDKPPENPYDWER